MIETYKGVCACKEYDEQNLVTITREDNKINSWLSSMGCGTIILYFILSLMSLGFFIGWIAFSIFEHVPPLVCSNCGKKLKQENIRRSEY
tara:strand:+ start:820 stop:1089 length:270 start_codon:yes stop_codon:yes gene_type:complete